MVINGPFDDYTEENADQFNDAFHDSVIPHLEDVVVTE